LKPAGGSILLLASLGFLVYDSLYCSEIDGSARAKAAAAVGHPKQLYDCALTLAVLGGVVGVLLLVLLILSLLGVSLPKAVGLILWIIPLVLFLGLLIAGAIAVDGSKYSASGFYEWEDSIVNGSDALSEYIDGYLSSLNSHAVSVVNGRGGQTVSSSSARGGKRRRQRLGSDGSQSFKTVQAEEWNWDKIRGSTAAEYCTYLQSGSDFDEGVNVDLTFSYERATFPLDDFWPIGQTVYSLGQVIAPLVGRYTWHTEQRGDIPVCYNVEYDQDSVKSAFDNNDLCEIKLKDTDGKKCAPGWTPELAMKAEWCDPFKECQDRFNRAKDSGILGEAQPFQAEELPPGSGYYRYHLGFPKGWNAVDDFNAAYLKYEGNPKSYLYGYDIADHLANSILLGFAVVGAVFLLIGVIVEAMGDGTGVSVA
jgi:hypothetical protein